MKLCLVFAGFAVVVAACSSNNLGPGSDGGGGDTNNSGSCPPCVTGTDCTGGTQCVMLGSNSFCMPPCSSGSCSSGMCTNVTTFDGNEVQSCVPSDECGENDDDGGTGDSGVPYDGGTGVTGTVGPNGGSLSRLLFSVVGDTRPATYEDLAGYPTAIITQIYQDIEAFNPKPAFVVATGDYQFSASGSGSTANQQLALYAGAAKNYSGVLFPAMGNHECNGSTDSNCGSGNTDGITSNYTAFMNTLLAPISKTSPYYVINVNAIDNSWTSKFVFIAANAWDSAQSSWLTSTMAVPTTYTFVIRHEPPDASPAGPGQAPSEAIIAGYPYTLEIVGHSHTYGHYSDTPREVLIGNGGAPLSSKDYGFGIFSQRGDGAIVVDMIDYKALTADSSFHFVVTAAGTLTN